MAKGTAKAVLVFALFLLISLFSCQRDIITVGPNRKVFAAGDTANRMSSYSTGFTEGDPKTASFVYLSPLTFAEKYRHVPAPLDRLADYAKSVLDASGRSVAFVNAKDEYQRGESITLSVVGKPNTVYVLRVRYKSGYSSAKGLGYALSDELGYALWTFRIGNASSDDFVPYFEVTGGGETIKHSFRISDKSEKQKTAPETAVLAPLAVLAPEAKNEAAESEPVTEASTPAETDQPDTLPQAKEFETGSETKTITATETKPAQQPAAPIEFIDVKTEYRLGETVTLAVRGAPNTIYTLKVRYKSGYSTAKGLGEAKSDASGYVSWTFKISPNADVTFEPWFEVTGGGASAKKTFRLARSIDSEASSMPAENPPEDTVAVETRTDESAKPDSGSTIKFVGVRDTYLRGETVTVVVIGKPNTIYTLKVKYKSGYSTAKGLGDAKSNDAGEVSWTFRIGNRVDLDFRPSLEVEGGGELAVHFFSVTG